MLKSDCCDPDIVLRNEFPEPSQVGIDLPVVISCPGVDSKNGTEPAKILDLPEAPGWERGFVGSVEKLAQSNHGQVESSCLL